MSNSLIGTVIAMHTYCRPHGSAAETVFVERFIVPLGAERDIFGNWHLQIGDSPIVWSCHTDTVHRKSERQTVHFAPVDGSLQLSKRSKLTSSCLGADDTAGVFLCCEMIKRGVAGHYIFHYGEEVGGLGSRDLAREWPELLNGATIAIALDRGYNGDVITHQFGGRTASDAFAQSLAEQLQLGYAPCANGIYTDTAEYADLLPECTNLSVGYRRAHSPDEWLDTSHLFTLLDRLCALDQSALVVERDPTAVDPDDLRHWFKYDNVPTFKSSDDTATIDTDARSFQHARCPDCDAYLWEESDATICWKCGCDLTFPADVPPIVDEHLTDWTDDARVYLSDDYAAVQRALRQVR